MSDWEYWVIDKPEYIPNGHKCVGIQGYAYCCAPTRAAAGRRQLEMGIRARTDIVYMGDINSPDYDGGMAA